MGPDITTLKVYGRIDGKLNETKTIVFLGLFTDLKTEKLSNSKLFMIFIMYNFFW